MGQKYPDNSGATENPSIDDFTFSEPKVFWLYIFGCIAAAYIIGYILLNKLILSKFRWYKVIEDNIAEKSEEDLAALKK